MNVRSQVTKAARLLQVLCCSIGLACAGGDARAATDWLQYIASHADLARAFGADPAAGERHYLQYGQSEGRELDRFDEAQYLENYPDLQAAFGSDSKAATVHYIQFGLHEGRTAGRSTRNVLLLIVDDIGVDAAEFYPTSVRPVTSPPAPPMPNLTALARSGVLFSNAWATPLCAPSRAALFTGRYGFRTGMGNNPDSTLQPRLASEEVLLPELFSARPELGYLLGHVGKWHVSPGTADPNVFGWPYFAGTLPSRAGLELYFAWKKDTNGVVARSRKYATTDQVDETLGLIREARRQGRNYFVQVAFNAAHSPYHVPPDELHSRGPMPPFTAGMSPRPYFDAIAEALDREIGRLLQEVNLSDTTIILVGDNGTAKPILAAPHSPRHAKGTLYETGIRVPLLIAGSGVANPGRLATGVVNTVDIFPTILELAGIPAPATTRLDGLSLLPDMRDDPNGPRRSWAYAEQFTAAGSYQRAIRNDRYKLIERSRGAREFYDLTADPLETSNLLRTPLSETQQGNLGQLEQSLGALLDS